MYKEDVAIILGDSPIISTVESAIPLLLDMYFSIGINRIIKKFTPAIHTFLDVDMLNFINRYPHIPVVTISKYNEGLVEGKERELIDTFVNKVNSFHTELIDIEVVKGDKIAWCGFTHDYALSYLVKKGYKKIVLIGAADFVDGKHYSNDEEFNRSKRCQDHSIQFLNEVNANYAKLYTLNPNPLHNATPITLDELLKGEL